MSNFTKVLVGSSLVLGAALFSIGCGGGAACCSGNDIDAKVNLLPSNNLTNGNTLPLNDHTLTVNGFGSTSDGTITQAVWRVYEDCTKNKIIDGPKTVSSKDTNVELDLGNPGTHKVCVTVTDTNGNFDEDCKCITVQEHNGPTPVIAPTTIKAGCPLDGSGSISHSNSHQIQSYKWSLNSPDADAVSTEATYTLPKNTTASKVCLTVTDSNGDTNSKCDDITPHEKPVAVLNVFQRTANSTALEDGATVNFGSKLNLTCAGSHDDCPLTEGGRAIPQHANANNGTCEFNGASYMSTTEDCSVEPAAGVVYTDDNQTTAPYWYKENCKLTGELTQASNTAGAVTVDMCGTPVFNCVKFWVDVTDEFGGTARATKVFKVSN